MIGLESRFIGVEEVQRELDGIRRRTGGGRGQILSWVGHRMAFTLVPMTIRNNPDSWARPKMRAGVPMRDTGRLMNSIAYVATPTTLKVGTGVPYGGALNKPGGMTIVPRVAKFLAIPVSPPLTVTEARSRGPRAFPGAFVLMHGPEGPGVYRKSQRPTAFSRFSRGASKSRAGSKGIERIFALVKSVHLPERRWLAWRREYAADLKRTIAVWAGTGKVPGGDKPMTGGTKDRGPSA